MEDTTDDLTDEFAANLLTRKLQDLGMRAHVHWDRSPWGVAIPLLDQPDIHYESLPTLYVLTSGEFKFGQRVWTAHLGGFSRGLDDTLDDFVTEVLQRGTFERLASLLAIYVELLRQGVIRTHAVLS